MPEGRIVLQSIPVPHNVGLTEGVKLLVAEVAVSNSKIRRISCLRPKPRGHIHRIGGLMFRRQFVYLCHGTKIIWPLIVVNYEPVALPENGNVSIAKCRYRRLAIVAGEAVRQMRSILLHQAAQNGDEHQAGHPAKEDFKPHQPAGNDACP
jgi:hypothetical protein